jgi:hypothetical protein
MAAYMLLWWCDLSLGGAALLGRLDLGRGLREPWQPRTFARSTLLCVCSMDTSMGWG